MAAADLIRMVETLGAPYGLERSVKITPGYLAQDRCLISVGLAALGETPIERLSAMGNELGMPAEVAGALSSALQSADIVHFGYEATAGDEVYKIYFEYASDVRAAIAAMGETPVLVHRAFKWSARQPGRAAVTHYTWHPSRTRIELEARLRSLLPADQAPRALRCALALVSRTAGLADSGGLFLMEVEEPGNSRRSCDINVYDARLRLHEIADVVSATLLDFDIPSARAAPIFDRAADQELGHLSAGLGRDGEEFVTIYFGVEGH